MSFVSLTSLLTTAQLQAARLLIPGAYESDAPLHRSAPPASMAPTTAATPYVVHAPARPTTTLGHAAAILGDLALVTAILLGAAAMPALVIWGLSFAAGLVYDTWGRL